LNWESPHKNLDGHRQQKKQKQKGYLKLFSKSQLLPLKRFSPLGAGIFSEFSAFRSL